eukprot:CAMPEP_0204298714 /NCGR_PEP_ID=MMETSP0468-20130131/75487_1 /ASSEMBLY_ACC=CAM_ASM_000383 /TAXON_ID=2969 /ORGANISM="Oxyrrhis marina" /LENGTH=65 /DNA_ID=CAMNT_0051277625 /DNA_START=42 /DNA_END=236 /DNA_ORIENTATION=-
MSSSTAASPVTASAAALPVAEATDWFIAAAGASDAAPPDSPAPAQHWSESAAAPPYPDQFSSRPS